MPGIMEFPATAVAALDNRDAVCNAVLALRVLIVVVASRDLDTAVAVTLF